MRCQRAAEIPWQSNAVKGMEYGHLAGQAAEVPSLFRHGARRAHSRRLRHRRRRGLPALLPPRSRPPRRRLPPATRLPRRDRRL
jgi:hypothetical protein